MYLFIYLLVWGHLRAFFAAALARQTATPHTIRKRTRQESAEPNFQKAFAKML